MPGLRRENSSFAAAASKLGSTPIVSGGNCTNTSDVAPMLGTSELSDCVISVPLLGSEASGGDAQMRARPAPGGCRYQYARGAKPTVAKTDFPSALCVVISRLTCMCAP